MASWQKSKSIKTQQFEEIIPLSNPRITLEFIYIDSIPHRSKGLRRLSRVVHGELAEIKINQNATI